MGLSALMPPASHRRRSTPAGRDRIIDAVRASPSSSSCSGTCSWPSCSGRDAGEARIGNLMASYPALQYLTWLLQVMPIFFAFGGAASVIAWRKADAGDVLYSTWMWGRVSGCCGRCSCTSQSWRCSPRS